MAATSCAAERRFDAVLVCMSSYWYGVTAAQFVDGMVAEDGGNVHAEAGHPFLVVVLEKVAQVRVKHGTRCHLVHTAPPHERRSRAMLAYTSHRCPLMLPCQLELKRGTLQTGTHRAIAEVLPSFPPSRDPAVRQKHFSCEPPLCAAIVSFGLLGDDQWSMADDGTLTLSKEVSKKSRRNLNGYHEVRACALLDGSTPVMCCSRRQGPCAHAHCARPTFLRC